MGGTIEKTDNWGRRKLAYEIGHHKEGTYVLEAINGCGELMKEIDRRLKVTDLVIRHLIVRVDEEQAVVERTRTKRTETSRRRRVARGLPPDRQPGEGQRGEPDDDRDDRFDMGGGGAMNGRRELRWRRRRPRRQAAHGGQQGKDGQRRPMFRRRKVCKFCADKIDDINYKDSKLLMPFVPERAKILPRRISGTCAMHQRKLRTAIMRARQLALIPYTAE